MRSLNKWLAALVLSVCGATFCCAKEVVRSVYQLTGGAVIKIYPKESYGNSHCGDSDYALSCSGPGGQLNIYKIAQKGCEWTLIDTGNGYFYLRNEEGAYWATQSEVSVCNSDEKSAVRVRFTWDSKHNGICFWNEDGLGLNNQNGYMRRFSWYSSPDSYDSDANTTYDVELIKDGDDEDPHYKEVTEGKFKYLLNFDTQTAKLLSNGYEGDIVVPHYVDYEGKAYAVDCMSSSALQNCTNIDARYVSTERVNKWFFSEDLQSIIFGDINYIGSCYIKSKTAVFGNVKSVGSMAFYSNLESVSFKSLEKISTDAFVYCQKLKSFTLPATVRKVEDGAFQRYLFIPFTCYVSAPWLIDIADGVMGNIKELYVPQSALADYKNTSPWKDIASRIYPIAETLVEKIEMPQETVIEKRGKAGRIQLAATVLPSEASNKTLKWSSSMEGVATVDDMGYVMGLTAGEAVITASSTDGSGVSAECRVTVKPIAVDHVAFLGVPEHLNLGEYVKDIKGKVDIYPENADCADIQIQTSEPDVVRYYPDTNRLYAKADGQSTITAIVRGLDGSSASASTTITVGSSAGVDGITVDETITVKNVMGITVYHGSEKAANITRPGIYLVTRNGKTLKTTIK